MALDSVGLQQPLRYTVDVKSGLVRTPMTSQMMKGDKKANRVIVTIKDGSNAVDLSGVTVTGSFIRPPDAAEIPLEGSANGSEAIVVLDDACYAQEGYCEINVKLTVGETSRTILTLTGYVLSKGSGAYIDVGGVIPSLDDIIAQYATMKQVTEELQDAAAGAEEAKNNANSAAAKIDGMTVSAKSADTPGARISEKNGVKHIEFDLVTPNITFHVATGAAGTDVLLEQSGTAEKPVIKLTIPRGDTGNIDGLDYYEGSPEALGTASPGDANGVARGDHVHPMPSASDVGARASLWLPSHDDIKIMTKSSWDGNTIPDDIPNGITYAIAGNESEGHGFPVGFCTVLALKDDTSRVFQILVEKTSGKMWIRSGVDSATWGDWKPYLRAEDTAANASKLGGNAPEYYMADYGRGDLLWEGSWSSGDILVKNTSRYIGYKIGMSGQGAAILAMRQSMHIRGIGGYSDANQKILTYHFAATEQNEVWTLVACNNITHTKSSNHGSITDCTVTSIVGLF